MYNVKKKMDIYFDNRAPSIIIDIDEYRNGYMDMKRRGGKIRVYGHYDAQGKKGKG
jgi:hypothetical protein